MVKSYKEREKSFSLVEILVVVSIILLFTGFSIANYSNFNQESILKKEVQKFIDVLSLVKTKAVTADIDILTDCGADEFVGYRIEINDSSYNFKQSCRDVDTKIISTFGTAIQSYNFPANISKISGESSVDFYPLSAGASRATVTIKNNSISKCIEISISVNGVITAGDQAICS